jgi:DNA-binding PadR family transcriptional regulator
MKGEIIFNILERIKDNNAYGKELLKGFLLGNLSLSKVIDKTFDIECIKNDLPENEWKKAGNRFYSMLNKLEKDGLIKKTKDKNKSLFGITSKGKEKLKILKNRKKNDLPFKKYKKQDSNRTSIVIFDIPEKYRRKRDWLRVAITNLGFKMIQKSVWIGDVKISKDFLESLKNLYLLEYVEIFEITKQGTLKSLK